MSVLQAETAAAQDPDLQARVAAALMQYANTVATEPSTTANHTNRVNLISEVSNNQEKYVALFTEYATQTQNVTGASTDAEVQAAVATGWTNFAGLV